VHIIKSSHVPGITLIDSCYTPSPWAAIKSFHWTHTSPPSDGPRVSLLNSRVQNFIYIPAFFLSLCSGLYNQIILYTHVGIVRSYSSTENGRWLHMLILIYCSSIYYIWVEMACNTCWHEKTHPFASSSICAARRNWGTPFFISRAGLVAFDGCADPCDALHSTFLSREFSQQANPKLITKHHGK
jgi:hypothetical protein